jgi:hypothetical protein
LSRRVEKDAVSCKLMAEGFIKIYYNGEFDPGSG